MSTEVKKLIERAASEPDPLKAMQLTQAALNAANALRVQADMPNRPKIAA